MTDKAHDSGLKRVFSAPFSTGRLPYQSKIAPLVIGLLIFMPIVSAQTYLEHQYDEIDLFEGCSYYNLANFDQVLSLDQDTLVMQSKLEQTGKISDGFWEWKELIPHYYPVVDKIISYQGNSCYMDNSTQKEVCNQITMHNYTYKDVIRYEEVWNDYAAFGGKVAKAKNQMVRYCADIERIRTMNGFEVSVDIVPKYDKTIYSHLNWWNSSWLINQAMNITNNNQTNPIEQGYSLNLTFDHASLVSLGQSLANGTDIRVVCGNVSIDWFNVTEMNLPNTQIDYNWTGGNISASGFNDTHCQLFYDNPLAPAPPNNPDNVYWFYESFDTMVNGSAVGGQRGWTNANSKWIVTDGGCNTGQCAYFKGDGASHPEKRLNHTLNTMVDFFLEFYSKGKANGGNRYHIQAFMHRGKLPVVENAVTFSLNRNIDGSFIWFALDGLNDLGTPIDDVYSHFIIRVPRLTSRGFYFIENVDLNSTVSGTQATDNPFTAGIENVTFENENDARAQKESWVDDILIRRFLQDEPTVELGIKEFLFPQNTSMLAIDFNISDFTFSSTSFVSVGNVSFNTSLESTFILLSSMNVQKLSPGASNTISVRVLIDSGFAFEEVLRTVTSTSDIGSTGTSPFLFNLSVGEHNIEFQFARTGNGNIGVTNIDTTLLAMLSNEGNAIRSQQVNLSYTHSSLDYTTAFNWTINKAENSSTVIISKQTVDKLQAGDSQASYKYFDFLNSEESPFWSMLISGAGVFGSLSSTFIQEIKEQSHDWSLLSKQTNPGDTVNVNGTLVDFDLLDINSTPIASFQESNIQTNETNWLNLTAGTHLIATKNVTVFDGDSYFLSMSTTMRSQSGVQTPTYFINSTGNVTCRSEKERYISSATDIGNAFIYFLCRDLVPTESYVFNLYVEVDGGETLTQMDESFNGIETKAINITIGNLPPIPGEITNPINGTNVSGSDTITWLVFFDPNLDPVAYNVTLNNPDGTFNGSIGVTSSLSIGVNWNTFSDATYILVVNGSDPSSASSISSITITIVTVPVPPTFNISFIFNIGDTLPISDTFCQGDNLITVRERQSCEEETGACTTINQTDPQQCRFGCSNESLSNWGNPGCIESDLTLSVVLIAVVLISVFSIRRIL